MTTVSVSPATFAFFKAAGVFRVKSDEKARKRFDEALPDMDDAELAALGEPDPDALFAALLKRRDDDKAARIAADVAREERKAEREAAEKAKPITGGMDGARDHVRDLPAGCYVLTSAQNNTDVDAAFLASLHVYCKAHGAQLLAGRMTYNKGGFQQPDVDADEGVYYSDAIKPYLVRGTLNLGGAFYFLADANVIPTAKWPTSSFGGETPQGVGAIVPATRIEMRTTAALKGSKSKAIFSTGAVTKRNYIMRKTGAIAAAGHNIGAVFVNTITGEFRHLEQMAGSEGFYDVDGFYSPEGFEPLEAGSVAAFQPGDIHAEKTSDAAIQAACDMVRRFQPSNVFLHDLLDFTSRNHHNIKDPFFLAEQVKRGATVAGDLRIAANVLARFAEATPGKVRVIVSNHDQAADKWLSTVDWRFDPINADTYLTLALAKLQSTDPRFNTLEYACQTIGGGVASNVKFHVLDESVIIAGVECGSHGHNGANGSKGSPKQFAGLGVPMNTGHTHSPSIYGSCYTAGALEMEMGYNVGASSWAVAHTITYDNGQRQVLFSR